MKKKKGANKASGEKETFDATGALGDMGFWRKLASEVCPELKDEMQLGELAVMLLNTARALGKEQPAFSKICNKNEDRTIGLSLAVGLDRRNSPPEIKVTISYSEKHRDTFTSQVPDPNQTELPLSTVPDKKGDGEVQEENPMG